VRRVEARYAKGHDMSKLKIRVGEVEDDMLVRRGGVDVRCGKDASSKEFWVVQCYGIGASQSLNGRSDL
jgi:hypothetical protein